MTVIARVDADAARELHALAFPADSWPEDDFPDHEHGFWIAGPPRRPVGFCSAILWPDRKACFLSRAAVVKSARGSGLHNEMISTRILWAWKQGADRVVTYTTLQNYASMVNLLASGFKFYEPPERWVGKRVHYFQLKR